MSFHSIHNRYTACSSISVLKATLLTLLKRGGQLVDFYFSVNITLYIMQAEGLLPAHLCLVVFLSSEQCLQFESSRLQHVQTKTKHPVSRQNRVAIMSRRAELAAIPFDVSRSRQQTCRYKLLLNQFWAEEQAPSL